MDRDTFSHIRLWCPRPFGTYSQNKPRSTGTGGSGAAPSLCKADTAGHTSLEARGGVDGQEEEEDAGSENTPPDADPASAPQAPSTPPGATQMEDGRVLLDTWYVIKPGNTKEKIAFFVAHQFSGVGLPRPSALKVKGNWATDCTKAKRRRRCSSYDPPARAHVISAPPPPEPSTLEDLPGVSETDLLSVAEMVALVEQRTAVALQGMVAQGQTAPEDPEHTLLRGTVSDPSPMVFLSESPDPPHPSHGALEEEEEQQESRRVAQVVAHFESQHQLLENTLRPASGLDSPRERERSGDSGRAGSTHGRGEVRIAFRVSSLDPRSQSEPAGRPRCMFMSCGGGGGQAGARANEKITCDLYQLVSPSSLDPSLLLAGSPKADPHGEGHTDRPASSSPDPSQELGSGEKKPVARERVTGFHVEVVVTGAVDQCVFYGKDSTENVQEETVCFAMPSGVSPADGSEDPPPGQLFFLQPQRGSDEDSGTGSSSGMCSLDCANNNNPAGDAADRPDSPLAGVEDCSDPSLCRLYRHVSHDFLEIRFQIQRLLEPRQYMLLLPDHIMVNIFSYLPTRSLAALKCTCYDFKVLIETYGVPATDSRWNQDPLYRDDPCKQCKRQYERGDVSLCRWHPKPYHHDLPYGRSYWMCCRRTDKDTPGCCVGLHDNNWVLQPCELVQTRAKREDGR
ncbi:F-box only protein 46 [Oncorhynchus kisutch]|uniref:F-box protein 46 n=1 Tax=Oncorhynchus kisutch TaxID=8019 RepID=A0A8C7MJY2_ONCKI|nr:F-box only protein 46 [Oncorhynchus kisutch]